VRLLRPNNSLGPPLCIGHRNQKEVKRQRVGGAGSDVALAHQALIDPAKLPRHLPQPVPDKVAVWFS
jgi:hypothetical protein